MTLFFIFHSKTKYEKKNLFFLIYIYIFLFLTLFKKQTYSVKVRIIFTRREHVLHRNILCFLIVKCFSQVFLGHVGVHDIEGNELPRLVYVSREKRPGFEHHKKAGAMNALVNLKSLTPS